jgi:predicted membrane channel-forming protein YqfA (hemolysin III family)
MNENKKKQIGKAVTYQIIGWGLFIICAIFFIASSIQNHDTLTLIGSVIFLIACIVFLIPLFKNFQTLQDENGLRDERLSR